MKNVLVVDSNQVMLKTLVGLLKSQSGFINIFEATSSKYALKLLEKKPIDIVITSIRLPTADGFNLVTKLTRGYPSIKVIIMTEDAHPLLRASIKRIPSAIHLDQSDDIGMLTKRVFTELQIDYGGNVRGINLSSFLQMMELESCTCTLKVTSKELIGSLWLKNGELIAAKSPTAEGRDAAYDILAWKNIFIDIDYTPREVKRQISMPLMMIMLESSQRYDESQGNIKNSRAHERYDLLVAIDYDFKKLTRQCFLRDVSLGGAYIETEQELKLEQNITLILTSPELRSCCSIEASVVRKDSKGVGCRFQINSTEQLQVLRAMINSSIKSPHRQEETETSPTQAV